MDTHEGRRVATFEIPGAYIYAETEEDVIMLLEGALSELMVKAVQNIYQIMPSWEAKGNRYYTPK